MPHTCTHHDSCRGLIALLCFAVLSLTHCLPLHASIPPLPRMKHVARVALPHRSRFGPSTKARMDCEEWSCPAVAARRPAAPPRPGGEKGGDEKVSVKDLRRTYAKLLQQRRQRRGTPSSILELPARDRDRQHFASCTSLARCVQCAWAKHKAAASF